MNPQISLIIPAYNEEARIEKSLRAALNYLEEQNLTFEIIVVDDGSKDNTSGVIRGIQGDIKLITLNRNTGKGAAVRAGMLQAAGEYSVFSDADFSTPIHELKKILAELVNGSDICIGSRALDKNMIKLHQPFYRELMGKMFNKFVQAILIKGISDTQCGFKGFSRKAAQQIFPKSRIDGFSFDVEILYLAKKAGLKIVQIPVEWYNDGRSKVNPVVDSLKMLFELLKIKKLHS